MNVFEPMESVDFDHDGGGIGAEKILVDPEDELVVPCGVVMAMSVDPGRKLPVWVDPRHGVSPH